MLKRCARAARKSWEGAARESRLACLMRTQHPNHPSKSQHPTPKLKTSRATTDRRWDVLQHITQPPQLALPTPSAQREPRNHLTRRPKALPPAELLNGRSRALSHRLQHLKQARRSKSSKRSGRMDIWQPCVIVRQRGERESTSAPLEGKADRSCISRRRTERESLLCQLPCSLIRMSSVQEAMGQGLSVGGNECILRGLELGDPRDSGSCE